MLHLDARGDLEQAVVDVDIARGRHEGCAQNTVANEATCEVELARHLGEIEIVEVLGQAREHARPKELPLFEIGLWKMDLDGDTPPKGLVEILGQVRREDGDARETLDALEQVIYFQIRVAVMRVLDLGALGKEAVGLVEEDERLGADLCGLDP